MKSFLMSCRVIGREIEKAFLHELLQHLSEKGVTKIRGSFIPTDKNAQVEDFYKKMGFNLIHENGRMSTWSCMLSNSGSPVERPDFIEIIWN
jgi:predicted enzyme involved in methoxymalonyl-ACP biosynthesis